MNRRVIIFSALIICSTVLLSCKLIRQMEMTLCVWAGGKMVYDDYDTDYDYCVEKSDTQTPGIETKVDPIKAEENDNTFELADAASSNQENLDITGTFIGSTTINQQWIENWGGNTVRDEIIIEISKNGDVNGSIVSLWNRGEADPITWEAVPGGGVLHCVTEMSISGTGSLSGRLTEQNNVIQIEMTWEKEILRYDCPTDHETQTEIALFNAELSFADGIINGTVPGQFAFEAQK